MEGFFKKLLHNYIYELKIVFSSKNSKIGHVDFYSIKEGIGKPIMDDYMCTTVCVRMCQLINLC